MCGPCDKQASHRQECVIGTLPEPFRYWPSSMASQFLRTGPLMEYTYEWPLLHLAASSPLLYVFIPHLYPALVSILFTERSLKASTHRGEQVQLPASLSSGSIGQGL